jgi:hypothetical protein
MSKRKEKAESATEKLDLESDIIKKALEQVFDKNDQPGIVIGSVYDEKDDKQVIVGGMNGPPDKLGYALSQALLTLMQNKEHGWWIRAAVSFALHKSGDKKEVARAMGMATGSGSLSEVLSKLIDSIGGLPGEKSEPEKDDDTIPSKRTLN